MMSILFTDVVPVALEDNGVVVVNAGEVLVWGDLPTWTVRRVDEVGGKDVVGEKGCVAGAVAGEDGRERVISLRPAVVGDRGGVDIE